MLSNPSICLLGGFSLLVTPSQVTLLKIRLLLDVRALQHSTAADEKLPQAALDNIPNQLVSTIVAKNKDIMESKDQSALIEKLESQVNKLYTAVKRENKYF